MCCTRSCNLGQLFQSYPLTSKSEKCGMSTSKSIVTKEKFLEWEIVKIINKQVMYEELGSAAPESVITCSSLSWDDVSGKHLQRHFALSRGRVCLSRSLTRSFLLIKPKDNKKHFLTKPRSWAGMKGEFLLAGSGNLLKKLLGLSLTVFHLIHLLCFNEWLQLGGQCEKSLLSYQGMSGIKIQMFLILTVGNNTVPQ